MDANPWERSSNTGKQKRPGRRGSRGVRSGGYYYLDAGAVAGAFFFLCFLGAFGVLVALDAAGASAVFGAAVFGISAAIAPVARPIPSKAEIIKVPDLVIASPTVGNWVMRAAKRIRRIAKIQPR